MKHIKFILKLSTLASGFFISISAYSSSFDLPAQHTNEPNRVNVREITSLRELVYAKIFQTALDERKDFDFKDMPFAQGDFLSFSHEYTHNPNPVQDMFYPFAALEVAENRHKFTFEINEIQLTIRVEVGRDSTNAYCLHSLGLKKEQYNLLDSIITLIEKSYPKAINWKWELNNIVFSSKNYLKILNY